MDPWTCVEILTLSFLPGTIDAETLVSYSAQMVIYWLMLMIFSKASDICIELVNLDPKNLPTIISYHNEKSKNFVEVDFIYFRLYSLTIISEQPTYCSVLSWVKNPPKYEMFWLVVRNDRFEPWIMKHKM